ncbi:MAG: tetratricopeptide repeat protein [Luteitalea sp.]|nr:tetratricopeptide repeat protein [Luteitalea sp.]
MGANGRRRLSRRQRRVLWTAVLLTIAVAFGGAALVWTYRQQQSAPYRPGEANPDVTASLLRDPPRDAARPVFADVTREAGLSSFRTFAGDRTSQLPEDMGPGAAWGDYDNDGDDDLFLVSAGGPLNAPAERLAPSALYENLGNGRFQRVTDFPEPRIVGMGAAWGDYDGDGWLDLVVTGYNALLLFRNDRGRFLNDPRFKSRSGFWAGAAWGDYDNDGRLDLYVCGYVKYIEAEPGRSTAVSQQYGRSVPYTLNPASYEPERNLLFRNTGGGTLVETAARLGVVNPEGRSLSALWHDFDDDGWLDLYVANDISDNVLYRNVKGRFGDVSHAAWVADYRGAMGLTAGDWNRDGDDDLFITHWVAQENALYDSLWTDVAALRFADAADIAGVGQIALPMVGWGAEFLDFDSDGWLDLVVGNGSTFETEQVPKRLVAQRPFLFWNRQGEYFHDVAPLSPVLAQPQVARGVAVADYDNDGDQDVLVARNGGGVQLLRNDTRSGQWVQVVLRARPSASAPARVARGAAATAQIGSVQMRRAVTSASYLSQSTSVLHFGLGSATAMDHLRIRWRAGAVTEYGPLAAGRRWEITEGEAVPRGVTRAPSAISSPAKHRERIVRFWNHQRAAMHALKVEKDAAKAAGRFREALALDPAHEDARYYLATSLAEQGDTDGALAEYEELMRLNPRSHRALAGWARLRAMAPRTAPELIAAEEMLIRAHTLNPEETGTLLTLGEIALMRGKHSLAEERFETAVRTNTRAAGGLFLLGYVRWKAGDLDGARYYLRRAREALGPDWKPAGTTAEGDVTSALKREPTPLSRFWDTWNGTAQLPSTYTGLDAYLRTIPR